LGERLEKIASRSSGADAMQYGDKKIGERSTQTDPTLVQTSNSKNVPQFFQAQPRKNIGATFKPNRLKFQPTNERCPNILGQYSKGCLFVLTSDLLGFNVTLFFTTSDALASAPLEYWRYKYCPSIFGRSVCLNGVSVWFNAWAIFLASAPVPCVGGYLSGSLAKKNKSSLVLS